MKRLLLVLLLVLSLFGCSGEKEDLSKEFEGITKDSYKELINEGYIDTSLEYEGRIKEIDNVIVGIKNNEEVEPVYTLKSDNSKVVSVRKIEKDGDTNYIKMTTYNVEDASVVSGIYDSNYTIIKDGLGYNLWLSELDPSKDYKKTDRSELIYTCNQDLVEAKDIDDSTVGGLNIFEGIKTISIKLSGSNLDSCTLTFDNSYTLNRFVENIDSINDASKYVIEEESEDTDSKAAPVTSKGKDIADSLEWFDLCPILTIEYDNGEKVTITQELADENGFITIKGTNYYGHDINGEYINDKYIIPKTLASLIEDLPYISFKDEDGNITGYRFLKPTYYKGDGYHIESSLDTIYDNKTDVETLYLFDIRFVNYKKYEIYEDDTRLRAIPTDGEHKIEVRESTGHNKYALVYDAYSEDIEDFGTYEFNN